MKKHKLLTLLSTVAIGLSLVGCSKSPIKHEMSHLATHHAEKSLSELSHHKGVQTSGVNSNNVPTTSSVSGNLSQQNEQLAKTTFNINKYPENVMSLGKSTITQSEAEQMNEKQQGKAWYKFAGVDSLGRSGLAQALITSQSVTSTSQMKRPAIPASSTPSGYKGNNKKVQLTNYRGFFYNKSHSIGWSLIGSAGGEATPSNPIMSKANLTTGTRAQNVGNNGRNNHGAGGMAYSETIIRNYLKNNPNKSVYYVVMPVYLNNELVPRGSHVEAYSVQDGGKAVNLNLWVFNTQDGATINYNNGSFTLNK